MRLWMGFFFGGKAQWLQTVQTQVVPSRRDLPFPNGEGVTA